MKLLACMLVLASAAANADPSAPIFIIGQPNRSDEHGRVPWHAIEGDRHISEADFLDRVGLHELATTNRRKIWTAMGFTLAGSAALAFTALCIYETHDRFSYDRVAANDAAASPWRTSAWVSAGTAVAFISIGIYEAMTVQHLSVFDARALAARHNAVQFSPVVMPSGAGVSAGGHF